MDLLERYLSAIERALPTAQAADIKAELRDVLLSRVEDQEARLGRPLTALEMEALLVEFGHPLEGSVDGHQVGLQATGQRDQLGVDLGLLGDVVVEDVDGVARELTDGLEDLPLRKRCEPLRDLRLLLQEGEIGGSVHDLEIVPELPHGRLHRRSTIR